MDYEDEDGNIDGAGTDLVKDLRKQIKTKDAELAAQGDRLKTLEMADRKRTVAEVLKSKGVKEGLAAYYPADAEATPEKVAAWVVENADVFGVTLTPPEETPIDEATVSGMKAIAGADNGAAPDPKAAGLLAQVLAAPDQEALEALIFHA